MARKEYTRVIISGPDEGLSKSCNYDVGFTDDQGNGRFHTPILSDNDFGIPYPGPIVIASSVEEARKHVIAHLQSEAAKKGLYCKVVESPPVDQ